MPYPTDQLVNSENLYTTSFNKINEHMADASQHEDFRISSDRGTSTPVNLTMADAPIQRFGTTLTQAITVNLPGSSLFNGAHFRIVRTGLGSFTIDVGGLKTIPSATAAWVEVGYDGSTWRLIGYGTL